MGARDAAKYGKFIKPIVSVGMHFYIRVFVEVYNDTIKVQDLSENIGNVYQSTQCSSFHVIPHKITEINKSYMKYFTIGSTCKETGAPMKICGPIWIGPLHDQKVVKQAINHLENTDDIHHLKFGTSNFQTKENLIGLMTVLLEELPDVALYYKLPDLCHDLKCSSPPRKIIEAAIINAGFRVSRYHKEPQAIKTDAPNHILWDIMRAWCKENPTSNKRNKKENTQNILTKSRESILAVLPSIDVDFTIPEELKKGYRKKVRRFPMNPQANWGPKPKASRRNLQSNLTSAISRSSI